MYIFPVKAKEVRIRVKPSSDGRNCHDFFVPDVIGKNRFAKNYAGYPRNEISLINEQTDLNAAKKILDDLTILPDYSGFENDVLALQSLRSKYCQTFSEGQRYVLEQMDIKLASARASKSSEETIQFEKDDGKVEDNE